MNCKVKHSTGFIIMGHYYNVEYLLKLKHELGTVGDIMRD